MGGEAEAGVVEVVDVLNKGGRPPRDPAEWARPFLRGVRKSGNLSRSARRARISPTTMRKHARADPGFARRIAAALREYGDALEENLGDLAFKGNAIANIARLKALNERLARKYSEKAVDARILNATINVTLAPHDLPSPRAEDVLDSTLAALAAYPDASLPPDLLRLKHSRALPPAEGGPDDAVLEPPPPAISE